MYTINEPYKRCKEIGKIITPEGFLTIYEIPDTICDQRFTNVYKSLDKLFEAIDKLCIKSNISD